MPLAEFMSAFPSVALPLGEDVVTTKAMKTDDALLVFFTIHKDTSIPPHSHGPQWGTVIEGEMALTMNGKTRICRAGDQYDIPAGTEHAAALKAGTVILDVFAENDRYPLK